MATTPVDLSRLPPPAIDGLALTLDECHAALLQALADGGWQVTAEASDPAWRLTRLFAGREALVRAAVADAVRQTSLAYATGSNLDNIGVTYYALVRLDGETDAAYRERLASGFERYAVGLSGPWYESLARGVAGVSDARVVSPAPGAVTIWLLADRALLDADTGQPRYPSGIPDRALLDAVTAVVTADAARQQTDRVTVRAATRFTFDVTATLTLRAEPDRALALAAARSRLAALLSTQARLGAGVSKALCFGAVVDPAAASDASIAFTQTGVGVRAGRTFGSGAAAVDITAAAPGPGGNAITVRLARGAADQLLTISFASDPGIEITAYLGATAGTITTTAAQLVSALTDDADVAAAVSASLPKGEDGSGVVAVVDPAQSLSGGGYTTADVPAVVAADDRAPLAGTITVEAA